MSKGCLALKSILSEFHLNGSQEESFSSMEGLATGPETAKPACWFAGTIDTVDLLVKILDHIFAKNLPWEDTKCAIMCLLSRLDLTTNELNKYTFWDHEKAYTRNLVHTDNKHYTLLLLCWSPGKESKVTTLSLMYSICDCLVQIHNHPCDGCFVKSVGGCVRETRYAIENGVVKQTGVKFFLGGQVSYMDDSLGFHKIGNPLKDTGSITLHCYTPPYSCCKVWMNEGDAENTFEIGKTGYFSVVGHRTPSLEAHPGAHARLMKELRSKLTSGEKYEHEKEVQFVNGLKDITAMQ